MELPLNYDPVPKNAPKFASDVVQSAAEVAGVELDYSVASLKAVDKIIEGFRAERVERDDVACTLFQFGCYVGEVFVRHANGRWRATKKTEIDIIGFPLVVELPNNMAANPIGKVFNRMKYGKEDYLPY